MPALVVRRSPHLRRHSEVDHGFGPSLPGL